jgi:tetratricopeptide (TPR) repeat protein
VANHGWPRPGANITAPRTTLERGNSITWNPRTDIRTGSAGNRSLNVSPSGRTGLSSAANAASRAAGREYARNRDGRWNWRYQPWFWAGYGYGSGSGSGDSSYGSGYGSGSGYGDSSYGSGSGSTGTQSGYDSSAYAGSREPNSWTPRSASSTEDAATTREETPAARQPMDSARLAFQKGDYAGAQRQCEQVIQQQPGDANLHEFRALCQFAQGQYKDAASTLYPVLAAGPGWDWNTLSSFYTSAQTYTKQLRALEQYVKDYPNEPAGHFVLAYHYLVLDEPDAALGQLHQVVKLQPRDQVSPGILAALEKAKTDRPGAPPDKPAPGR